MASGASATITLVVKVVTGGKSTVSNTASVASDTYTGGQRSRCDTGVLLEYRQMLKLALFVLPLGLDTFAVSAALGIGGLPKRERLKLSLLISGFEMAMPVVGLLLGRGLGTAIGRAADYVAAVALLALGAYILVDSDDEATTVSGLVGKRGLALIGLGISISLDELAMGFTIGLLGLSIVLAVILIGVQAFVVAQIGLRLGARVGSAASAWAEKLAGAALLGLGALILVEKLS